MHVDLRHLRLVEAIDRLGSLTRAAETLHLSQPAASHALRDLEHRLGVELFRRQGRRLAITDVGQRLARRARTILAELHAAEGELTDNGAGEDAVLRLTTECYTCYHWLPAVLKDLQVQLPRVRLELAASSSRQPVDAILADEADFAVVFNRHPSAALEFVPLFASEIVLIVAPGHRLAGHRFVTAEDLRDEHLILHYEPATSLLISELLRPAGLTPARSTELRLTEAVVEAVKAGLGVAALARWAAAPHLEAGTLCAVSITPGGFFRQWWACYQKASAQKAGVTELVRLIRERGLGGAPPH